MLLKRKWHQQLHCLSSLLIYFEAFEESLTVTNSGLLWDNDRGRHPAKCIRGVSTSVLRIEVYLNTHFCSVKMDSTLCLWPLTSIWKVTVFYWSVRLYRLFTIHASPLPLNLNPISLMVSGMWLQLMLCNMGADWLNGLQAACCLLRQSPVD